MTGVAMYRARDLLQDPTAHPTLPDIGFDIIPTVDALCVYSNIESYFLITVMLYTLVRMMLTGPDGWMVFCRFAVCDGILMMLRATTVSVTSLNNPWPECFQCGIESGCPSSLLECITYTVSRFPFYDCGDLIFSGHTVHFLLTGFVWISYSDRATKVEMIANFFCVIIGLSMLLSCRFHYSIDILVAFYLTTAVWFGYHYATLTYIPLLSGVAQWMSTSSQRSLL
eukprot:TRINITY_DN10997_c0_g1_i1.p1 TRINITY_DN10997_c0_g1~~TRINITY_DN10997_c0_g1_i1.p1  ORF type:complete len:244 (+),score=12.94 TRINITY_DN10997_c0_g1_i1:57-734(+)